MEQKVPIPAATARRLALDTIEEARNLHRKGYRASARVNQQAAGRVLSMATRDKGGQFIPVDAMDLTAIAYSGPINRDSQTGRIYLEQYGVW